jgi:hypothetical protein
MRWVCGIAAGCALVAGCATSQSPYAGPPNPPPGGEIGPLVVSGDTIAPGTRLIAQLVQPIGTDVSQPGQSFSASVVEAVVDPSGVEVVPYGAQLWGRVADLRSGGNGEPASVALTIDALRVRGIDHPVRAHIVGADVEASRRGVKASHVLGGALGGAVLGAILGGGRGALVGGAVGAGAGTLISLGTARTEARLPAGTAIALELETPLSVAALRSGRRTTMGYPPAPQPYQPSPYPPQYPNQAPPPVSPMPRQPYPPPPGAPPYPEYPQ